MTTGPYQAFFATLGLRHDVADIEEVVRDLVGTPYSRALDGVPGAALAEAAREADALIGAGYLGA